MITSRSFLVGLALLLSLRLSATTVEPPDIDSLINQSDYVVRAVVKSTTPEWHTSPDGRPYISTLVELDLREVIKGTPPAPLVIEMLGGRIGQDELIVTGMPVLHAGEEHILFVHGNQRRLFPLVAMMHGIYPVLRERKSGQDYVLRSNGMPLYSTQDMTLPLDQVSQVVRRNSSAHPLTASAFTQQIRQRVITAGQRSPHEN